MDKIEYTFHDSLIEIDKWYFYKDKNGKLTYDIKESDDGKPFEVGYATEREVQQAHDSGEIIFVYKNKDYSDGLWHLMVGHDVDPHNIFNLVGAGAKTYKEYNYRIKSLNPKWCKIKLK